MRANLTRQRGSPEAGPSVTRGGGRVRLRLSNRPAHRCSSAADWARRSDPMAHTLVLNATYEPLGVVSDRRALLLVLADKATRRGVGPSCTPRPGPRGAVGDPAQPLRAGAAPRARAADPPGGLRPRRRPLRLLRGHRGQHRPRRAPQPRGPARLGQRRGRLPSLQPDQGRPLPRRPRLAAAQLPRQPTGSAWRVLGSGRPDPRWMPYLVGHGFSDVEVASALTARARRGEPRPRQAAGTTHPHDGSSVSEGSTTRRTTCCAPSRRLGVTIEYWDWQGRPVTVSAASVRAVLSSLGVDATTSGAARARAGRASARSLAPAAAPARGHPRGRPPTSRSTCPTATPSRWVELEDGSWSRRCARSTAGWSPRRSTGPRRRGDHGAAHRPAPRLAPLARADGEPTATRRSSSPRRAGLPHARGSRRLGSDGPAVPVRSRGSWGIGDLADLAELRAWAAPSSAPASSWSTRCTPRSRCRR